MRHGVTLFLSLLLLPSAGHAQGAGDRGTVSLSSFFDRPVLSSDGVPLGLTKHLAVNVKNGDAPWLALGTDDAPALVLVPLAALSGGGQGGSYRLSMTAAEAARAPLWPVDRLAAINRPAFMGALSDFYRRPVAVAPDAVAAAGEGTPFRFVGIRQPGVPAESFAGRMRLLGDRVTLASGRPVGTVSDLLLDLGAARVVEAAVDLPDRRVAMPFRSLAWAGTSQTLVSGLSDTQLAGLAPAEWTSPQVAQIAEVPATPEVILDSNRPGPRFW